MAYAKTIEEKENLLNNIDETVIKIIASMNAIGFPVERFSIEDILLHDLSDINAIYQGAIAKYGNTSIRERSYKFLFNLFNKYGGRTLFDVLEKIYGEEAEAYNTNLQVELMKEIKMLKELEIEAIIGEGTADLMG